MQIFDRKPQIFATHLPRKRLSKMLFDFTYKLQPGRAVCMKLHLYLIKLNVGGGVKKRYIKMTYTCECVCRCVPCHKGVTDIDFCDPVEVVFLVGHSDVFTKAQTLCTLICFLLRRSIMLQ